MEAYIVKHKEIKTRMDSRSGGGIYCSFRCCFE